MKKNPQFIRYVLKFSTSQFSIKRMRFNNEDFSKLVSNEEIYYPKFINLKIIKNK